MLLLAILIVILGALTKLLLLWLLLLLFLLMWLLWLLLVGSGIVVVAAIQQCMSERRPVLRARSQARVVAHAAQQILHVADATGGGNGTGRTHAHRFGTSAFAVGSVAFSRFEGRRNKENEQ